MTTDLAFPSYNPQWSIAENLPFPTNTNAYSTIVKVVEITTNEKTLETSTEILNDLKKELANLPIEKKDVDIENLKKKLAITKINQLSVNKMFETIGFLLNKEDETVTIDNDTTFKFLSNMKQVQKHLLYLSDYILLTLKVNSESIKKEYSYSDLMDLLKK